MNSPTVGMNTNRNAATIPGRLSGRVTRRNACNRVAPRSLAASSRRVSSDSSETKIGSATNGSQTYARTSMTAKRLYSSAEIGWSGDRIPVQERNELTTPWSPRMTFHASTRRR